MIPPIFDYIRLKIQEKKLRQVAQASALKIKSVSIRRESLSSPMALVFEAQAFYLGEIQILHLRYYENEQLIKNLELLPDSTHFPEMGIDLRALSSSNLASVRVMKRQATTRQLLISPTLIDPEKQKVLRLSRLPLDHRVIFYLDQALDITSLKYLSSEAAYSIADYSCLYPSYDKQGNWTEMQESINGITYQTTRQISYYREPLPTDLAPTAIQQYLSSLSHPYYAALQLREKTPPYYWIEAQTRLDNPAGHIALNFADEFPAFFTDHYVIATQPNWLYPSEKYAQAFYHTGEKPHPAHSLHENGWLILADNERPIDFEEFSVAEIQLPDAETYRTNFIFKWTRFLERPLFFHERKYQLYLYNKKIKFWQGMEKHLPERYIYEGPTGFCLVSKHEQDIEGVLQTYAKEIGAEKIRYKRGVHRF